MVPARRASIAPGANDRCARREAGSRALMPLGGSDGQRAKARRLRAEHARCRKPERERAADARRALRVELAPQKVRKTPADRKAESEAPLAHTGGIVHGVVIVEDAQKTIGCNA